MLIESQEREKGRTASAARREGHESDSTVTSAMAESARKAEKLHEKAVHFNPGAVAADAHEGDGYKCARTGYETRRTRSNDERGPGGTRIPLALVL